MDAVIAAVRWRAIVRPLDKPISTGLGKVGANAYVACEVFADNGEYGVGYVRSFDETVVRAVHTMLGPLAAGLIGKPVSGTLAAWNSMWKHTVVHGRSGIHAYGVSALDTGLWDLKAKLCGLPLYRLLGSARESVPSYYSGGFLSASDEELVSEAERVRDSGYAAFKMRIGGFDLHRDVARAYLLKEAFRGAMMMDAAGTFDRAGAQRAARELAALAPIWMEDPVRPADTVGFRGMRSLSPVPFAGGELLYTETEVADFAKRDTYDHILFDLQRIGGVTGWIKSASIAEHHSLRVSAHVFPEIAAHLLCGLENGYFHESLDWSHELFENPPLLKNGRAFPTHSPGLGLRFNEGFIRRYEIDKAVVGNAITIGRA